jgi:opacity protein-like surface antigen
MRHLKHLLTIALLATATALSADAVAQRPTSYDIANSCDGGAYTTPATPSVLPDVVIPAEEWKNHLQIGTSAPGWMHIVLFNLITDADYDEDLTTFNFSDELYSARIYEAKEYFVPSLTLEYGYKVKDWLSLGFKGYVGFQTQANRHVGTNELEYTKNHIVSALLFNVRFDWLRRDWVTLYSAVSVGAAVIVDENRYRRYAEGLPMLDLTYIGLNVGRSFYGFVEIGGGITGWGRVGLGVRF